MSTSAFDDPLRSAPIPGSYEDRLLEAARLKQHGLLHEALEIAERVLSRILRLPERRRGPASDLSLYLISAAAMIADIKYDLGDIAAAEAIWKQLEQWDTEDPYRWRREPAQRQIARGEVDDGLLEMKRLAEEEPDEISHWLSAGWVAYNAGQLDVVETCLLHAEPLLTEDEEYEDHAKFYFLRHILNLKHGHWRQALDDWYEAVEYREELEEFAERIVRDLLGAEQFDLALELLNAQAVDPLVSIYYRAWIAQLRGDVVRARHLWRELIAGVEADDDASSYVVVKALALCWLRQPVQAATVVLEEAEISGEMSPVMATAAALAFAMLGKPDESRADLTIATRSESGVKLISSIEWYAFDALISDEALKAELRQFFAFD